jgi:polyphosphate kinase
LHLQLEPRRIFEVRVAGIKQQIESDVVERTIDGLTASENFRAIMKRVRRMVEIQYRCWRDELKPRLAEHHIPLSCRSPNLPPTQVQQMESYYHNQVRPVLTPLAIDPAHPFPQLLNKSLNIMVRLEMERKGSRSNISRWCRCRASCRD